MTTVDTHVVGVPEGMFHRSALLLGPDVMQRMAAARVILFGVGGVGSWCAESLIRSGIRHLTLVDSDLVCVTNCNRQLMATSQTIGQVKVEAMRRRLLEICPQADIQALRATYSEETAASFHLEQYDYVIDAIDSLQHKAHLILHATSIPTLTLYSSMGAALRLDPLRVSKAEFWKVKNDALARALRNRFKRAKTFPQRKFQCIYSEEPALQNQGLPARDGLDVEHANGSMSLVTGTFGLSLASLVIQDIRDRVGQP